MSIHSQKCQTIPLHTWSAKQDPIFLKFAYFDLDLRRGRSGLGRPAVYGGPYIKARRKAFIFGDINNSYVIKGASIWKRLKIYQTNPHCMPKVFNEIKISKLDIIFIKTEEIGSCSTQGKCNIKGKDRLLADGARI